MSSPKAKKLSYTQVGHKLGFMEWNESYGVNVAAIDAQHKKIFQMISNFYNTMEKDDHKAIMTQCPLFFH